MYTVEIYKTDRRTKAGERLVLKKDIRPLRNPAKAHFNESHYEKMIARTIRQYPESKGYRSEVHETYVTKTNMMNGKEFEERYDAPYYCSPSSETYWSM